MLQGMISGRLIEELKLKDEFKSKNNKNGVKVV